MNIQTFVQDKFPGFIVAALVAIAAKFLSEHYGAPAMLMALLLGIAIHFLAEEGRCVPGIQFSASTLLRLGIVFLGARASVELLDILGFEIILMVIGGVVATIGFGVVGAKVLGRGWRLAILSGGSVAICGASAAMAIASVLPKNQYSERNLSFTVVGVTVLSTIAMIIYPPIMQALDFTDREIGMFLGGTIHDVAQVVGAGFSVSPEAGEIATVVKLIRVTMLAPIVLTIALAVRQFAKAAQTDGKKPPLIPWFVLGFLALAALNSFGLIPEMVVSALKAASSWLLLIAIAAVGMKTSLKSIVGVGGQAITLIVAETVFIAGFVLTGIYLLK